MRSSADTVDADAAAVDMEVARQATADEVIAAADRLGVSMVFTRARHFRH